LQRETRVKMDIIYTLAKNIIDTNYGKLPSDVVEMTKDGREPSTGCS